jgi:long-chain acyl-CoA synthetase
MADSVNLYKGKIEYSNNLKYRCFRELIDAVSLNNEIYCRYYSGGKLFREMTFSDLSRYVKNFASTLSGKYGIKKGDKVIVRAGNSHLTIIAYSSIMYIGAVAVPLDPQESSYYMEYLIKDSDPKGIICHESDTVFAENNNIFFTELSDSLMEDLPHAEHAELESDTDIYSEALLIYTSGTTGNPKGVLLTQGNILINAEAVMRMHNMGSSSVHMCVLPLFHVNAFNFSFIATLYCSSRLILNSSFSIPYFWDIVQDEKADTVSLVPSMIKFLSIDKRYIKKRFNLDRLKYIVCASAPLKPGVTKEFYKKTAVRVLQGYGLSEAVNFSLTVPVDIDDEEYFRFSDETGILPSGIPLYGNEAAVMDEAGKMLSEGQEGELVLRGWNIMKGYYKRPDETETVFRYGWLHTGDTGYFREINGRKLFYVSGRKKEIIKNRGVSIAPAEIENVLNRVPGLEEIAVVGFDNEYSGDEVGLYVVRNKRTPAGKDILELCSQMLPPLKRPKAVEFGEEIPKTSVGKIRRRELKGRFGKYKKSILS